MNKEKIVNVDIEDAVGEKFLTYAKKTIVDRSIPDITGCKPVHRRILWGMEDLKLTHSKKHVKSAKIVGNIIGNYHPHGDSSVYEAMVRLASPWKMRYPLIDGQGNMGSLDNDPAAAMRYTEMRPSKYAELMLQDYKKNAVNMIETFLEDGKTLEPEILPGLFPNILVNGNDGIAVGMSGNFLPHNLTEVTNAIIATIDNPNIDTAGLMEHIIGPDFPLGGTVINQRDLFKAYDTGRSVNTIKVRGDYNVKGKIIQFTSIPYGTTKDKIEEQFGKALDNLMETKIKDYIDESSDGLVDIKIELFKESDADDVLAWLFKKTDLQVGSSVIMNLVIGQGFKEEASLKEIIEVYIQHQVDIIQRVAKFELEKDEARQHILDGLLIALADIDEVVKIIRASKTNAESKAKLVERYKLSDLQVKAVLDIKLSRLNSLEVEDIKGEHSNLSKAIQNNKELYANEDKQLSLLRSKLVSMRDTYGDARRTKIENIEVVATSGTGAVKTVTPPTPVRVAITKNFDGVKFVKNSLQGATLVDTKLNSTLVLLSDAGMAYKLRVDKVLDTMQNLKELVSIGAGEQILDVFDIAENGTVYMTTKQGMVKKAKMSEFNTARSVQSIKLKEGDKVIAADHGKKQFVTQTTKDGFELTFDITDVAVTGRVGIGVKGIKLKADDYIVDAHFSSVLGTKVLGKRTQVGKKVS